MRGLTVVVLILLSALFAQVAHAELNGKKVIFVHGFQIDALNPFASGEDLRKGAKEQAGEALAPIIDEFLFYDSAERLVANSSTLATQIKEFESKEVCRDGCYFITASTGDLVTRYVISRLGQWGIDSSKFSILLSFDIVGAGGGTEAADAIIGIANGGSFARFLTNAITKAFFGIDVSLGSLLGIVNDLRPSIARNHASGNHNVPRLRVAAGKQTPVVSQFFIKGGDDGLVPLHSACGSARQESIKSCSRSIGIDGKLGNANGPKTLIYNYFPIIMAEDMKHTQSDYSGKLVAVNNQTKFSHSTTGSIEFSVEERHKTRGFWRFKSHYRTIAKPKGQLAVEFIIEEFD